MKKLLILTITLSFSFLASAEVYTINEDFYKSNSIHTLLDVISDRCPKGYNIVLHSIKKSISKYRCANKDTGSILEDHEWTIATSSKNKVRVLKSKLPSGAIRYSYDSKNRLLRAGKCRFKYDSKGKLTPSKNKDKYCKSFEEEIATSQPTNDVGCPGGKLASDGQSITCPNGEVFNLDTAQNQIQRHLGNSSHGRLVEDKDSTVETTYPLPSNPQKNQ